MQRTTDAVLAGLSMATLYAWNAMARANLSATGSMALIVELALVVIALGDAAFIAFRRIASAHSSAHTSNGLAAQLITP